MRGVIYCLHPGLHGEKFEGARLCRRRLRVEKERVVRGGWHGHGVAREGGKLGEQGLEAVGRQAIVGVLGGGLATSGVGALGGSDNGGARGGSRAVSAAQSSTASHSRCSQ